MARPAPTFGLKTLGCRVNQADSDEIARCLAAAGLEMVRFGDRADVVIVNTCTVTHVADRKSRQAISRALRVNPEAELVITGCYAATSPEELESVFPRARVMGKIAPARLAEAIVARLGTWREGFGPPPDGFGEHQRTRPTIKVQEGCRHGCAFCIVPRARGGPRSAPLGQVLDQVRAWVSRGAGEVVIAGIALGSYACPQTGTGLGGLIAAAADVADPARLRLSSIEPMDFDPELFGLLASGRICPHLHIPLQSGSGTTLRAMRRPYRPADYLALLGELRDANPDVAMGTDLMIGFPGESEDDHLQSLEFCRRAGFAYLHVFPYSRRARTLADRRTDHVPEPVSRKRMRSALALARQADEEFTARFLGRQARVIWERDHAGSVLGLTEHYLRARPVGLNPIPGTLSDVVLAAAGDGPLVASPIAV